MGFRMKKVIIVSVLSLLMGTSFVGANAVAKKPKPLFTSNTPITAVLNAPISSTYKQRKKDVRIYFDGSLSYKDDQGTNVKIPTKIKTRGNFRRLNCKHPPLRLNFNKKATKKSVFAGQNKLKLVAPCESAMAFKELIGLEYLAYQIWETVSDHHFKTRLIDLSYMDSDQKKKPWSAKAFVIEDVKDMAKRSGRVPANVSKAKRSQMDLGQTALLELFQLLISNTDYSTLTSRPGTPCCHNTRLISTKESSDQLIPVPYDFDVSGFVNAPYATPAAQYPIKTVRKRYFTGWCKDEQRFQDAIKRFVSKKSEINNVIEQSELITAGTQRKTLAYVEKYFTLIETPARVEKEIMGRCRGKVVSG